MSSIQTNVQLNDLPKSPPGLTGWPWTEEAGQFSLQSDSVSNWPAITIVTPSFNQGEFIEETIRSVLLQGYPNLEYIVIDGGSDDESVDIIRKYERWLTYWVSEPDRNQSHAINKGMRRATGEIVGWLNSDDSFVPGALRVLGELVQTEPSAVAWAGSTEITDRDGNSLKIEFPQPGDIHEFADWTVSAFVAQPGCIFRRESLEQAGLIAEWLEYLMDLDLWMRLRELGEFATTDTIVARAKQYPEIKSLQDLEMNAAEQIAICVKLGERDIAKRLFVRQAEQIAEQRMPQFAENGALSVSVTSLLRLIIKRIYWGTKRRIASVFSIADRK